jgi:hypothetical protein
VTGALVVLMPLATAGLAAASARFSSLVSAVLLGYLTLVAATVGGVLALSPFREVNPGGLGVVEGLLLVAALALWFLRGRPGLPVGNAWAVVRVLLGRPETAVFLVAVLAMLGYELVLGLTVPANNWDSLTYHLARVAAWVQHDGVYWIPNAPTDRINEFQPLAEQQIFFLFAATKSGALYALPQFVSELVILVAVYGAARRLAFDVRSSACASLLLATFSLLALQATTAQNDLVAAAFPIVAACLLLGETNLEAALAGVAVAFGLGVKLTTALVLPILALLAILRGRRGALTALAGALVAFAAIGMWGYVLNHDHTGKLLGHGGGRIENTTSPSWPDTAVTAFRLLYVLMDRSVLTNSEVHWLAIIGVAAGIGAAVWAIRRGRAREAPVEGMGVAIPFTSALLAIVAGWALSGLGSWWGHPLRLPHGIVGPLNHGANEDKSAFGPVGSVLLLAVPILTVVAFARGRADARRVALAASVPLFLILLVLQAKWNEFLTRFMVVPAVLAAPLLAYLFSRRLATVAYVAVASFVGALTITHMQAKPLSARPWHFSQARAIEEAQDPDAARALADFQRLVPPRACVGAVLGLDEPAYVLFGPRFRHHVEFLPVTDAVHQSLLKALFYVVISTGPDRGAAKDFRDAGWKVRPLGPYWLLASEPHATTGDCGA